MKDLLLKTTCDIFYCKGSSPNSSLPSIVENSDFGNVVLVSRNRSNTTFLHFPFKDLNTAMLNGCNKPVVYGGSYKIVTF